MNGRVQAIIRLVVTLVLFINAILTAMGKNPIPLDENTISAVISEIASVVAIIWAWWKNANITKEAQYWQKRKEDAREYEKNIVK